MAGKVNHEGQHPSVIRSLTRIRESPDCATVQNYLFTKKHLLLWTGIALELSRIREPSDRRIWSAPPASRFREHSFRQCSRARIELGTPCAGTERCVLIRHTRIRDTYSERTDSSFRMLLIHTTRMPFRRAHARGSDSERIYMSDRRLWSRTRCILPSETNGDVAYSATARS